MTLATEFIVLMMYVILIGVFATYAKAHFEARKIHKIGSAKKTKVHCFEDLKKTSTHLKPHDCLRMHPILSSDDSMFWENFAAMYLRGSDDHTNENSTNIVKFQRAIAEISKVSNNQKQKVHLTVAFITNSVEDEPGDSYKHQTAMDKTDDKMYKQISSVCLISEFYSFFPPENSSIIAINGQFSTEGGADKDVTRLLLETTDYIDKNIPDVNYAIIDLDNASPIFKELEQKGIKFDSPVAIRIGHPETGPGGDWALYENGGGGEGEHAHYRQKRELYASQNQKTLHFARIRELLDNHKLINIRSRTNTNSKAFDDMT